MDAEQEIDFLGRIRPAQSVPVHYDDYPVFRSPLQDFLDLVAEHGWSTRITAVQRGQTITLDDPA